MVKEDKLGTPEKMLIVFVIITSILVLIFIIKDRADYGCWDFGDNIIENEFQMNNYSCEELENILLLEVFPKEVRKEIVYHHCNGEVIQWGAGPRKHSYLYLADDYKDKYRNECLINSGKD